MRTLTKSPPVRSPVPSIPLPNQPYPDPTPADPNPAPSHPPLPTETPGPEPVGVPSPAPSNIPPPNEPAGVPPSHAAGDPVEPDNAAASSVTVGSIWRIEVGYSLATRAARREQGRRGQEPIRVRVHWNRVRRRRRSGSK